MRTANLPYRFRSWFCLCTIVALTACSIETHSPASIYQPQGQFSQPGTAALPDRWWLTFADPTLDQLIDRALDDNLSLQVAWDRAGPGPRRGPQGRGRTLAAADPGKPARARPDFAATRKLSRATISAIGLAASYEVDLWGRIGSLQEARSWMPWPAPNCCRRRR